MNKNRMKVFGILKTGKGESLILDYIPDPGDPKHDDLPSEVLEIDQEYHVTFEKVVKDPEPPFNQE